ncbi:MAG: hypothetical protein ABSG86_07050 [Thermoguttaceae bacterium]|jgi:hypothetical protein
MTAAGVLHGSLGLLAADVGEVTSRFEWGHIQSNVDWILPIAALLGILIFVRAMYQRDAAELPAWLSWLLTLLRTATFVGLLFLYLQPQWRCSREIVHNSRVLLLVDTSMSMNRVDTPESGGGGQPAANSRRNAEGGGFTRLQQVAAALEKTDFLARLRKTHDVVVQQFNNSLERDRAVILDKIDENQGSGEENATGPDAPEQQVKAPGLRPGDNETDSAGTPARPPVWKEVLQPRGTETRMGEALEQLIRDERNSPISGIVVIGDGGQNAGVSPEVAVEMARQAWPPLYIHTVGVGSERRPATVRVYDLKAPARAYPGDRYTVTGFVQGQGLAGRTIQVELLSREGEAGRNPRERGKGQRIDGRQVTLARDGEIVPVKFELSSEKTGRRTLCLRVQAPPGDTSPLGKFLEAEVDVVDRKNHVLLLAGGPMRDYQYLRTLLYRDRTTTVDVLLQSGQEGISQEANKILDEFPALRDELYAYDCIVAFDPDWKALGPGQIDLLESWVGDQGGGLIVVAGPVHNGRAVEGWVQDPEMVKIRTLYPVEFNRYLSARGNLTYAASEPWPLDFTREGLEAEYLWLGDTAAASAQAWAGFPGVYGFCPLRGPKPGATVLARFSDPRTAQAGKQPVFFAEQFYGSGRVFYMGSGEMWRLRAVEPNAFEQVYTKLIRHVSQGRLLRQSTRGVLLVGQDHYLVGSTVEVRAQLTNSRLDPLSLPAVSLQVSQNGAAPATIKLLADPTRAGTYLGQFPVLKEGEYRLELPIPESREEPLTRSLHVVVPKLEEENPQRNTALLKQIAAKTGGTYYPDLTPALADSTPDSLVGKLEGRSLTEVIPVAPDPKWEEDWLRWMMIALCAALCLEWLLRRLARLA